MDETASGMENVNFQPSGEEIERALMDLGPLLGVSIKEEVQDELADGGAAPAPPLNVRTAHPSQQHQVFVNNTPFPTSSDPLIQVSNNQYTNKYRHFII